MVWNRRHRVVALALFGFACGGASQNEANSRGNGGNGPGAAGGAAASSGTMAPGGAGGNAGAAGIGASHGGAGASGSGNATGIGAGGSASPELSSVDLRGFPIYTRVQRLTNQQWENAVSDILRFSERHRLSDSFIAPVAGLTAFDNNEQLLFVNQRSFTDFEAATEAAAAIATGSVESLAALHDGEDADGFVRTLGRRAFRRPLTPDEETKYRAVFARGEALYGQRFASGAALVIRAMLQSPHFLYRTELGAARAPLDGYELASKLSFWLLGTTPSDSLLDAAQAGELDSDDGLEALARRMLEDPRAQIVMRDFHGQLMRLKLYDAFAKFSVPELGAAISQELRLVSEAFFDRVFRENLGLVEILTSKRAFVGSGLAPFYGMSSPAAGLELRDLGGARSGYFMQVPFLMLWANDTQPNPIGRGLALQRMLCAALPTAPVKAVPPLPAVVPGETNRQRVTRFTAGCGDCHSVYVDPLGFALENFDGLGRERQTDNGQPVETSGSYPFAEGIKTFADGNELMGVMAKSSQVHTCYSKNLASFALGRDVVERDRPLLESLARVSSSESLKEMVIALVRSPAFRLREEGLP